MKETIRKFRMEKGVTQQELAEKAGVSRRFVNILENSDEINVASKSLVGIALALGVSVDDLLFADKVYLNRHTAVSEEDYSHENSIRDSDPVLPE